MKTNIDEMDDLMACLLFAEASKKYEHFIKDAIAIAWVVRNRLKRPKRFGESIKEIILKKHQFSGVGSAEWNKADRYFGGDTFKYPPDRMMFGISYAVGLAVLEGDIPDPTCGADHYFNPQLCAPEWAKSMTKTYTSGPHDFYREKA